jgi:hypothetical protein
LGAELPSGALLGCIIDRWIKNPRFGLDNSRIGVYNVRQKIDLQLPLKQDKLMINNTLP